MSEGQIQRNPMNIFRREFQSVDSGPENGPLIPYWAKQEPSLFTVYGILTAHKESEKSNGLILTKKVFQKAQKGKVSKKRKNLFIFSNIKEESLSEFKLWAKVTKEDFCKVFCKENNFVRNLQSQSKPVSFSKYSVQLNEFS